MIKKILIIDDDDGIKDAVKAILESEGFEVEIAADEKSLLQSKESAPGLIFLDYFLSGRDGATIAANIRSHLPTKKIPIVMLSADPSNRKKIKKDMINDFLDKPFEMNELISIANKYLN